MVPPNPFFRSLLPDAPPACRDAGPHLSNMPATGIETENSSTSSHLSKDHRDLRCEYRKLTTPSIASDASTRLPPCRCIAMYHKYLARECSCLYGCFSKPPDVVVSDGGVGADVPLRLWDWRLAVERSCPDTAKGRAGGTRRPSNMASVAAHLWSLILELRGKHHILGSAETTV